MKIREHGIQTRERLRIHRMRPKCEFSDGKNFGSVRISDIYAAILMFAYGLIITFLIFCGELFMKSKYNKISPMMAAYKEKMWRIL